MATSITRVQVPPPRSLDNHQNQNNYRLNHLHHPSEYNQSRRASASSFGIVDDEEEKEGNDPEDDFDQRRQRVRTTTTPATTTTSNGSTPTQTTTSTTPITTIALSDALDSPDPLHALHQIQMACASRAEILAHEFEQQRVMITSPASPAAALVQSLITQTTNTQTTTTTTPLVLPSSHCGFFALSQSSAECLAATLSKLATRGAHASQEFRTFEHTKQCLDDEAYCIDQALTLRHAAHSAQSALQSIITISQPPSSSSSSSSSAQTGPGNQSFEHYLAAAQALAPWLEFAQSFEQQPNPHDHDPNAVLTTAESKKNHHKDRSIDHEQEEEEMEEHTRHRPLQLLREKTKAYLGESAVTQLTQAHHTLQTHVTQQYQHAVHVGDLQTLGALTPVLALIHMEDVAVRLYLQYLESTLTRAFQTQEEEAEEENAAKKSTPHSSSSSSSTLSIIRHTAKIYNLAVQYLRHHLPLVSHCLGHAAGDVQVVLLVQRHVSKVVVPLLADYTRLRQWKHVTTAAITLSAALAERAVQQPQQQQQGLGSNGSGGGFSSNNSSSGVHGKGGGSKGGVVDWDAADCGFSARMGSLMDVNACMDESALLLQHAESYTRFVAHACHEINRARQLRGLAVDPRLSQSTQQQPLYQVLAEFGGDYATVEHCLLLATMLRAFHVHPNTADPQQYYCPLSVASTPFTIGSSDARSSSSLIGVTTTGAGSSSVAVSYPSSLDGRTWALQTSMMDTCWYAARKSTQRAFATGHTGTASAVVNFTVDGLLNVLLKVASERADDAVSHIETLLLGTSASSLLLNSVVMNMRSPHHHHHHPGGMVGAAAAGVVGVGTTPTKDEVLRKQLDASTHMARVVAVVNDLEVARSHSIQLGNWLRDTVASGFPQDQRSEQLLECVQSMSTVTEGCWVASSAVMDNLESALKPRLRSILGETSTEGGGASSSISAASSSFMVGVKGGYGYGYGERVLSRMNYNLNDEKYNLLQLSESYVTRLISALDELLDPLRETLAPRLWDKLFLDILGTVGKRLEASLRKCELTSLGALALDADVRDLLSYAKERLYSPDYNTSNVWVAQACPPLARLLQIAKLVNVDELEDAVDLIASSKHKNNWDLKLDDSIAFLSARVEFGAKKVNDLLRGPDNS